MKRSAAGTASDSSRAAIAMRTTITAITLKVMPMPAMPEAARLSSPRGSLRRAIESTSPPSHSAAASAQEAKPQPAARNTGSASRTRSVPAAAGQRQSGSGLGVEKTPITGWSRRPRRRERRPLRRARSSGAPSGRAYQLRPELVTVERRLFLRNAADFVLRRKPLPQLLVAPPEVRVAELHDLEVVDDVHRDREREGGDDREDHS